MNLAQDSLGRWAAKHNEAQRTPEYRVWINMKGRCCNPNYPGYERWGGRGITVCDEWLNDFERFLADVGRRTSPKHSLDRWPDKNGNYEIGNVRWASRIEQARNTRSSRIIEFHGESKPLVAWAEETGLP